MKTFLLPDTPQALLFDIDNTLYRDDEYVRAQVDGQIARFCTVRGISATDGRSLIARTRADLERTEGRRPSLANTLVALGVPIAVSIEWRRDLIEPERYLNPDREVAETLARLGTRFRLVALTNNPRDIGLRSLRALGIAERFEAVTGLDDSGASKPSWEPFQHSLTALNLPVSQIVMVGDRHDVDLEPVIRRGGSAILVESRDDLLSIPDLLEAQYALPDNP